jgi:hypothetical protein
MNFGVAESAKQFEVVPVQRDVRIIYVVRCQLCLVVNYLAVRQDSSTQTPLTQVTAIRCVSIPTVTPQT